MKWVLRHFESIDSTNRYVLDEARAGAPEGVVAVADYQTAGRGRRGRSWTAPPGSSLLVSVLLRPSLPPERTQVVTMAAGLAMADAVEDTAGLAPELKWPNDLLIGPRKLAGILAEADVSAGGDVRAVVVGVGVNVSTRDFPAELAGLATSCVLESGREIDRLELLDAFLERLGARCGDLDGAAVDYRRRLATLGRGVRVERGDGPVTGRAVDLGPAGELLVEVDPGCVIEVRAGDVVHLRDA